MKTKLTVLACLGALMAAPVLAPAALADAPKADVHFDTSSQAAFEASVQKMRASLSSYDRDEMMIAFDRLTADAIVQAEGAQAVADKPEPLKTSLIDAVYARAKSKLAGADFDALMKMTGEEG